MEDQKVDRSRMTDFSGKTAIVTGATGGMGRGIAEALARSGADLVVHTTNAVAGERLVRELRTRGVRALPVEADLRNLGEARRVAEQALGEFGRIDLLVNNAGIWDLSDLTNMTEAQWEETIDVNLKGPRVSHASFDEGHDESREWQHREHRIVGRGQRWVRAGRSRLQYFQVRLAVLYEDACKATGPIWSAGKLGLAGHH